MYLSVFTPNHKKTSLPVLLDYLGFCLTVCGLCQPSPDPLSIASQTKCIVRHSNHKVDTMRPLTTQSHAVCPCMLFRFGKCVTFPDTRNQMIRNCSIKRRAHFERNTVENGVYRFLIFAGNHENNHVVSQNVRKETAKTTKQPKPRKKIKQPKPRNRDNNAK